MPGFELIGKDEANAVAEIFKEGGILFAHGFDSLRKKYHVREFESKCSEYFKVDYSRAVSSGTAGLKCALKAVGVQQGDEVITQSFNFIATIEAIVDCGASPIVCDIDNDLHLDLDNLRNKITKKTKAIIIVHMLGMGGYIEELLSLGNELGIPDSEYPDEQVYMKRIETICKNPEYNSRYLGHNDGKPMIVMAFLPQNNVDLILELLAIDIFKKKNNFEITLLFSKNRIITLSVEVIEVTLEDQKVKNDQNS